MKLIRGPDEKDFCERMVYVDRLFLDEHTSSNDNK